MTDKSLLESLDPCEGALIWYNSRDSKEAWETCERGDWMLWVAAKLRVDRKLIVLSACDCVEPAMRYIPADEHAPQFAINVARQRANGVGGVSLRGAEDAGGYASVYADYVAANAAVANAAVAAAAVAYAASHISAAAAYVANVTRAVKAAATAYAAAAVADADACRRKSLHRSADLVRARIPWRIIEQRIETTDDM